MVKRGRPKHPDILTPREWEVLALLREGLTNDQIAGRLDVSERTARYHVSEILGKLGLSSRQEAAAWSDSGERRPWWQAAATPLLFWRRLPLGWLAPVAAGVTAIGVAAGVGLLVWGLVRTEGEGDGVTLTATPEPGEKLVWEGDYLSQRITTASAATCGDADTAERYDVPMTLDIREDSMGMANRDTRVLLGLEAEPYEYVPAQVYAREFSMAPEGWELSDRVFIDMIEGPEGPAPTREFFLRRLDQPSLLFRYYYGFCDQEDGSPIANPSDDFAPGETVMEMPNDIPQIVEGENEGYISLEEAIDIARRRLSPDVTLVKAQLLETGEWFLLLAAGDAMGPRRPGHEYGFELRIDAVAGNHTRLMCCIDFVSSP